MDQLRAGLLDRLLDGAAAQLSLEQYKEALLRDLEDLLNTRSALAPEQLHGFPRSAASVLNYGLADFAGLSLNSSADRARICAEVRLALERHEPRLRQVQVALLARPGAVNRIDIAIRGVLRLPGMRESVSFNAVLQPSSLHYAIKRGAIA